MHVRLRLAAPFLFATVGLFVLLTGYSNGADGGTTEIPLTQVPRPVVETVKKLFPDAQFQSASQGMGENKLFYDVYIKVKTQNIWITCDAGGGLLVVDREIGLKDLPRPVSDMLHRRYPKATIRLVNEIAEGARVSYDIALTFNQKKLIALFQANGQFVEEMPDEQP
jgi:hypothetical protein